VKPQFDAKRAEEEGWPLEIVVLKDEATFQQFCTDTMGNAIPGARAFYSPKAQRVLTYDDRANQDPDTKWFNESVLIHETFHMLSDFYAANPIFTDEEQQTRPRYANILVQEGLTDSVSGFSREGTGSDATYKFLQLNHLRLRDFQFVYKLLKNNLLYRIRDTIECRHYGQCTQKAFERARELKLPVNPRWLQGNALGIYYPTVCQISYFFQYYKVGGDYPYRDKWWKYIGMDYKGEIGCADWNDNRGITKFKEVFGIKDDKDWDALDKKFLDFTLALKPENVGKSGGGEVKGDGSKEDGTVNPGFPPMPGAIPGGGKPSALPGREDDDD
jgi:hypothetical protein